MKKHVIIFVHTEYHLLLAVNQVLMIYKDQTRYEVDLYIRKGKRIRLNQKLDFNHLPISVHYFNEEISIYQDLSNQARKEVEILMENRPDIFIFFQEMDPLMVILSGHFSRKGSDVYLFQDGFKPYINIKYHSIGLLKYHHRENLWIRSNGFPIDSWLSPLYSKKYAFLKGIKKIYLTFPDSYMNWNKKPVEKIEFLPLEKFNPVLKKLFSWDDSILPERENIILYMNQPIRDDGKAETELLKKLGGKFPNTSIYIKLHPYVEEKKVEQYSSIKNVKIIHSTIPAELFIMNLKRSIILSVHSTSMFLNNPANRFYYLYRLLEGEIGSLARIKLRNEPAEHITHVYSLDEISF